MLDCRDGGPDDLRDGRDAWRVDPRLGTATLTAEHGDARTDRPAGLARGMALDATHRGGRDAPADDGIDRLLLDARRTRGPGETTPRDRRVERDDPEPDDVRNDDHDDDTADASDARARARARRRADSDWLGDHRLARPWLLRTPLLATQDSSLGRDPLCPDV